MSESKKKFCKKGKTKAFHAKMNDLNRILFYNTVFEPGVLQISIILKILLIRIEFMIQIQSYCSQINNAEIDNFFESYA